MSPRRTTAGMTLVEAILAMAIFSSLLVSLGQVMRWREANTVEMEEAALSVDLHEALSAMASELAFSGFTPDGVYPHLFEDGVPGGCFAAHAQYGKLVKNFQQRSERQYPRDQRQYQPSSCGAKTNHADESQRILPYCPDSRCQLESKPDRKGG